DLLNVESSGITVKNPLFKYRIDEAHRIRLRNQKFIGTVATSYDYIEKIFQIPFLLKPIDDKGKDQLIESQLNITTGKHDSKIEDTITIEQPKNIEVEESSSQSKNQVNKVSPVQTSLRQTVITNAQPKVKPVPGKSQKNKEATKLRSALLEISIDEVRFMQGISFLIGDTPRTIKRYVNIYRVIRIHPRFAFADSNELEHYAAAMVLLAMVTGMTDQSKDFFDKLRNDTVSETFGQFLQTWLDAPGNSAPLLVTLVESLDKEEALKDLSNIHIDKFKINLDLVSRFTFRN
ncbi:MAG: hypothetical protein IH598_05245, partial [Bacteroidales bacterium]|nr:hypothetical protein [Bacteroidales bacterium]